MDRPNEYGSKDENPYPVRLSIGITNYFPVERYTSHFMAFSCH
jgi:hypothetical protein